MEDIYRQYFPHFLAMSSPIEDGWGQSAGIDRIILLKSGKQIKIDEKVRYTDYGDILIEYWSDKEHKVPGWGVRELDCDYNRNTITTLVRVMVSFLWRISL